MMTFKNHIEETYKEEAADITNHGCSGGVSGLIYYTETTDLYNKHEDEIWEWLYEEAEESGMTCLQLVASFGGQKDVGGGAQFRNLLVWAFVESVCCGMLQALEI